MKLAFSSLKERVRLPLADFNNNVYFESEISVVVVVDI